MVVRAPHAPTRARTTSTSRSRARLASNRARAASRTVARASSSSTDDDDERAPDASPPTQRVGRFVKREGAPVPPARRSGAPGDVGSAGAAPPMKTDVISHADVQGVARATSEETEAEKTYRVAQLVAGDALAILAFAAIGRGNHGEGVAFAETASTALPFALGWFGAATTVGDAYGEDARGKDGLQAAFIAGKTWAVGGPVGLMIRSIGRGGAAARVCRRLDDLRGGVSRRVAILVLVVQGRRLERQQTREPVGVHESALRSRQAMVSDDE